MKQTLKPAVAGVQYFHPKPNPMFTELQTALTTFVKFPESIPCAFCQRRSKHHWTQLVPFKIGDLEHSFGELKLAVTTYPPLTPVCRTHILAPKMQRNKKQWAAAQKLFHKIYGLKERHV